MCPFRCVNVYCTFQLGSKLHFGYTLVLPVEFINFGTRVLFKILNKWKVFYLVKYVNLINSKNSNIFFSTIKKTHKKTRITGVLLYRYNGHGKQQKTKIHS